MKSKAPNINLSGSGWFVLCALFIPAPRSGYVEFYNKLGMVVVYHNGTLIRIK